MNTQMLKKIVAAAGAAAAAGLVAAPAHAEGLYVGGALGVPHFNDSIAGISGSGSSVAGKVFGGYQLNSNLAFEAGLSTLGRISNASGSVKGYGGYLDAVGLLPLASQWSLLGSVGVAQVRLDTSNGNDNGTGLKLGLGAEYALSRTLSLRGEYEHYKPGLFGTRPALGQYTLGVRASF